MAKALLEIDRLRVEYSSSTGSVVAIPNFSMKVQPGEAYGLVGESGCGKTTLLMAILGHLGARGAVTNGSIRFEGEDLVRAPAAVLRRVRGNGIGMVYQDPNSALNPSMTIGAQLCEVPLLNEKITMREAKDRSAEMLNNVNLPDPGKVMERFPHQLSGGQKQRVVIAMALLARPRLLLLDEPTTGLDVTVEAAVLDLVNDMRDRFGTSLIYITHNLGIVAKVCERVGVMYLGDMVEEALVSDLFASPHHPYTRRLMSCVPRLDGNKHTTSFLPIPGQPAPLKLRPEGCGFAPRCQGYAVGWCNQTVPVDQVSKTHSVRCVRWRETDVFETKTEEIAMPGQPGDRPVLEVKNLDKIYYLGGAMKAFGKNSRQLIANQDVNFSAKDGEILAVVGESGSGKSTFARMLTGLEAATAGAIMVDGSDVAMKSLSHRSKEEIAKIQMVFQNPDSTLNPSHRSGHAIERVLRKFGITKNRAETQKMVEELFSTVRLSPWLKDQRPARLSGGQKQRVAIARAFAAEPQILVADEPVSALDVSVQAAIINLLLNIQKTQGTTIVFISHDLALVRHLADKVVVLYLGRIMESGTVESLFSPPYHPYT
ncbi:MAG: ABC transporter ATP-binding protein, partial [Alphaproteobacteria bacterium]|nr:ABC transporter ATP-binding protein [Alphaproteobacteria bacterium]